MNRIPPSMSPLRQLARDYATGRISNREYRDSRRRLLQQLVAAGEGRAQLSDRANRVPRGKQLLIRHWLWPVVVLALSAIFLTMWFAVSSLSG